MKKNSSLPIKILNKSGYVFDRVTLAKAESFVRQHRCKWVSEDTLQLMIDSKDEKRMKEEVWAEANYICYICGKQMHRDHPDLTIDHMTPKRLGGSLLKQNMACCCKQCNEDKGCRTVYSYTMHLLARVVAMVIWYRVPVSRHVVGRRDASVQEMRRQNAQASQENKVGGAATSGKAESRPHS